MPGDDSNPAKEGKTSGKFVEKTMRIAEVMAVCPEAADILVEYGLHCFSCPLGDQETLQEGAYVHGFDDWMLEELVDDLNVSIET